MLKISIEDYDKICTAIHEIGIITFLLSRPPENNTTDKNIDFILKSTPDYLFKLQTEKILMLLELVTDDNVFVE